MGLAATHAHLRERRGSWAVRTKVGEGARQRIHCDAAAAWNCRAKAKRHPENKNRANRPFASCLPSILTIPAPSLHATSGRCAGDHAPFASSASPVSPPFASDCNHDGHTAALVPIQRRWPSIAALAIFGANDAP